MVDERPESGQARLVAAERRQRVLSDVSRALLDYVGGDEVEPLRRVVHLVTGALGDYCSFSLVREGGILENVATWHPLPRQRELAARVQRIVPPRRWDEAPAERNPLVAGKPIAIEEVTDELLRAASPSREAYEIYREIGLTSVVSSPMIVGDEPLGTFVLATTAAGGRRYTSEDLDFAYALASRAALAVRNARLIGELARERDLQREQRLEADRRFAELSAVLDSDPNGILLFDTAGLLRKASRSAEEIFGLPLHAMYGQHFESIYRHKLAHAVTRDRDAMMRRVQSIFADPQGRFVDELELEKPRHRHLLRNSVPVQDTQGGYVGRLVVYQDVTEHRALDRQRADFLTVAAHELRTPLTPLSMYLQSIERRVERGQVVEPELLGKARRQVGRLGRLVEDLLDVSRLESRRMQLATARVDLNELAAQVVADFRGESRIHELVFEGAASEVAVQGDRGRLEQVFVNLVQNAIKYSPHGGRIAVRVEAAEGWARVSVQDPGIGIPEEEQGRLFQRFFRAGNANTRNYSGLGIGLFVSHEIVQRHGGAFEVQSVLGRGSRFSFTLPLAPRAPSSRRARVLLVDDDPAILEATAQVLREWGYAVDEARDGASALSLARGATPDLMLVDLMMPVMDGWTLIRRLREERVAPGVPVVVFSADRDAREKARTLDASAALPKPFELEELQQVVERLLSPEPAA